MGTVLGQTEYCVVYFFKDNENEYMETKPNCTRDEALSLAVDKQFDPNVVNVQLVERKWVKSK